MRFHLLTAISVAMSLLAGRAAAEHGGLFEVIRHEVDGGGTVQLFDGGPPESEFISGNFPDDPFLGFDAFDFTGVGADTSSIGALGNSVVTELPGPEILFRIFTRLSVDYVGDGPELPGGTGEGEWLSIVEFVMPVEQAEWEFTFTQDEAPGFTQSSMVTVENVTANQTLVSTTEPLSFLGELIPDVGDVIRVTSEYTASGMASPEVSGFFLSQGRLESRLIIPEPATFGLVTLGATLCLLTRKRRGR